MTEVAHAGLGADLLDGVAVRPSWSSRDHERRRQHAAAQAAVRGEQARVVLARLDRADSEDEARGDAFGQLTGGD